jgi:hypothetical protein
MAFISLILLGMLISKVSTSTRPTLYMTTIQRAVIPWKATHASAYSRLWANELFQYCY